MTTLERDIFVNAPPDAIAAITDDPNRLPEWYAGVEQVTPDGVYPAEGGKIDVVYKAGGASFNVTMTSVEYNPNQSQRIQIDGMITGTNEATLTPEGDGTRVTIVYEYKIPGGALGKMLDKLVIERMNAKNLEESLKQLKALAEG